MSFVVVSDLPVLQVVSTYSEPLRYHFQQICTLLAENPYPSRKFAPIRETTDANGRTFYQYFDGIIPVLFHYRVFETAPESKQGLVYISKGIPIELL